MENQEQRSDSRISLVSGSLISEADSEPSIDVSLRNMSRQSIVEEASSSELSSFLVATNTKREQARSETDPFLSQGEHTPLPETDPINNHVRPELAAKSLNKCSWLPLTLRLPYLSFLSILSFILSILVAAMTIYSAKNYGIGSDNSSSALLFGWRFSPTLVATIYALLVASMLHDVRRTEVFAQLSRPGGASTSSTICFPERSWWSDPSDALRRRPRSWSLFFSSIVYILVILVVSPLSAGLLSPTYVYVPTSIDFLQARVSDNFTWQLDAEDSIMFRTISGAVLNQSTSTWLSKDSAILPFWSNENPSALLGSNFSVSTLPAQWKAETVAYRMDLICTEMSLKTPYNATYNYSDTYGYNSSANYTFLVLSTDDNCIITLADYPDGEGGGSWMRNGGGWWSGPPYYNSSLLTGMSNSTEECGTRTMFLVSSPIEGPEPFQIGAHLCSEEFFSASIMATASINQSSIVVNFDQDEFFRNQVPLNHTQYDLSQLRMSFLSSNWTKHFFQTTNADESLFAGPLMSIAASTEYDKDPETLLANSNLTEQASQLYQQFFGEMLLQTLGSDLQTGTIPGKVILLQRRILVSIGVGATLASLLLASTCCIAFISHSTRLNRRALNLVQDPGTIAAAASLLNAHQNTRLQFTDMDCLSQDALKGRFQKANFLLEQGDLININPDQKGVLDKHEKNNPENKDPRPAVFRTWLGILLLTSLVIFITAITALYVISITSGIHQSPFIYQLNLSILDKSTTLAPYSIIPTLLAVGIKLWFGAVGDTLKMFQPYVSLIKAPATVSSSLLVEYVNTPIALASTKAFLHSHWVLALVSMGALATEIFTVGMSAIWDREVRTATHVVNVKRPLELRTIPRIFEQQYYVSHGTEVDESRTGALQSIYESSLQSWLYGAAIEISQSASTPAWSKDTWSFLPLDSDSLQNLSSSFVGNTGGLSGYTRNITFRTSALRGRLECEALDYESDKSSWLTTIDFRNKTINPETNQTVWNSTNSPPGLDVGYSLTIGGIAGSGAMSGYLVCCANDTDGVPGEAAIGYWTDPYRYDDVEFRPGIRMQTKWIFGRPLETLYSPNPSSDGQNPPVWVWPEEPRLLVVNCTPVIELANASVVAEIETGIIYDYRILDIPSNVSNAWTDDYLTHNVSVDYAGEWEIAYGTGLNVTTYTNMTTSWGYVFWDALLNSGRAAEVGGNELTFYETESEDLDDRSFNFRIRGLNSDFMSYAMLSLANNSKEALLDPKTFIRLANQTFGVFLKHFVSENVTSADGGNAYQPIGEKLPWSLGPVPDDGDGNHTYQGAMATENDTTEAPRFATGTLQIPVEQLIMSPIAVYLCICLLAFLVVITIIMYTANNKHYKEIPRGVDMLASTLAFVYGSEKLLEWVSTAPKPKPWYKAVFLTNPSAEKQMMARMGPFRDSSGTERWGIELVEPLGSTEDGFSKGDGEWIEMEAREQSPKDDGSDVGVHVGLLGDIELGASSLTLTPSDLGDFRLENSARRLQSVDYPSDEGV